MQTAFIQEKKCQIPIMYIVKYTGISLKELEEIHPQHSPLSLKEIRDMYKSLEKDNPGEGKPLLGLIEQAETYIKEI